MAEVFSSPGFLDVFGGVVTLYCLAAASRFPRCSCFWRMSDEWLMMSATAGQLACSSILLWFSDIWLRAPTTSNHQQELLGKLQQFLEVMIADFLDMNGSSKPSVVRLPKRGGHKVDTNRTPLRLLKSASEEVKAQACETQRAIFVGGYEYNSWSNYM